MTLPCPHCQQTLPYQQVEALQTHRGAWQALCGWEQEQNPRGEPSPLRAAMYRIMDEQPSARATFALNTTRYDRPLDEAAA